MHDFGVPHNKEMPSFNALNNKVLRREKELK